MKQSKKVLKLCCGVTTVMLTLSFIPPLTIGGEHLRKVDILSDLKNSNKVSSTDSVKEQLKVLANGTYSSDIWPDSVTIIEDYSHKAACGMDKFYSMLDDRGSLQRPVRIAFLGDSFVEGDVLVGSLREMLQTHFGGNGIGWIDAADKANQVRPTIKVTSNGLTEYNIKAKNADYDKCCFSMRYATLQTSNKVTLQGTKYKLHATTWQKASIFLTNNSYTSINIKAKVNNQDKAIGKIAPSPQMKAVTYEGNMNNFEFSIISTSSKENILYGTALESRQGIIVDNFSMRGFSGDAIRKASKKVMQDFAKLREYDLIILEYGLNNASNRNTELNYKLYMDKMKSVITLLKEVYPNTSILVMGVPDRSERTVNGFQSMPCIEAMTRHQRNLASSEKVAFYSLCQAMGGQNSMKSYVDHKDANKDYTHLTLSGGDKLAKQIYQSILTGLDNYHRRNK